MLYTEYIGRYVLLGAPCADPCGPIKTRGQLLARELTLRQPFLDFINTTLSHFLWSTQALALTKPSSLITPVIESLKFPGKPATARNMSGAGYDAVVDVDDEVRRFSSKSIVFHH